MTRGAEPSVVAELRAEFDQAIEAAPVADLRLVDPEQYELRQALGVA